MKLWKNIRTQELLACSYYDLLDGDGPYQNLGADEACALLLGEIRKLNERVEKLEAAKVGEGEAI